MIIHFSNTELELPVNDNSYRYRAIKQIGSLTLYYSLPQHVEIPIGAWCEFEGETYTLTEPENFKKHSTRNFEYTLILSAPRLDKYKFKDTTSRRLKFSLTAKPHEHLQMLVDNLNQRETGWTMGTCIETVEKVISYNHAFCSDALSQIAEAFETEWEIVGKTINLCKVEYNKDNPLPLSYGRGNGFKTGIGRSNNSTKPIEILFIQGGERNIDASKYGSTELLLPLNQTIGYDGQYFSDQEGYDANIARLYVTDSDGFSIRRADKPLTTGVEDSLDCSHIYPSRVGEVTSVDVVDAEKHFYDFIDNTIPAELNFANCLIEGETLTVIFQTGMLVGKEFEVKYIHADRRFEIVSQEIDGRKMPDSVFKPGATDKYAVFGISLPDAYVCNNAVKTGASWDMFREAAKYLYENEGQKFTFTGELDGIWSKKDWLNIGGKIKLGGYVLFTDNQFQPDGVLIRIVGIKDYINNPHSPHIELSNEIVGSSIASDLRKIETNEVIVDDRHKDAIQFTKRRFRDSQETISMLEAALLDKFTNSISPVAVQTMAMLVGDESLQFRFVNNTTNPSDVAHNVTYNKTTKILTSPAGIIQHMTLGIDTLSSGHAVSEYKFWTLPNFETPPLTDSSKKYYLYAKISKTATTGTFYISENAIGLEAVSGYYHLLMGILNSEYEGDRSYVSLYGFTEILPGRITTDRVVSADGLNFIDFINNAARIGDNSTYIDFNTKKDGKLRIKGTLVQSESGDENFIGVFRGVYNSTHTYYQGDEVTYTVSGVTSTHRYIYALPTKGNIPTNATYWQVIAQGVKGDDGMDGVPGKDGENGVTYYTWIRYADTAAGGGISNSPTNKLYIGFAYNKTTATESNIASDYTWSLIKGDKGDIGVQGASGADGITTYTWIKYSDYADGTGLYDTPTNNTKYIGIAVNKTTAAESSNKSDYTWSRFKGDDGMDGDYYEYRYAVNGSHTSPPTLPTTSAAPNGWSTTMPTVGSLQYLWCTVAKKNAVGTLLQNWSTPIRISGIAGDKGDKGDTGEKGDVGPVIVFRGVYSSIGTYYGTSKRIDCVKYNNMYYIARVDAGNGFIGRFPTNTTYWNTFGAQFESIATNFLLAENANIAGWIFRNERLESQSGGAWLDGRTGEVSITGMFKQRITYVDPSNVMNYVKLDNDFEDYVWDIEKYGSKMVLTGDLRINENDRYYLPVLYLPSTDDYINTSLYIRNSTPYDMGITGNVVSEIDGNYYSIGLMSGYEISLTCIISMYNNTRQVAWLVNKRQLYE
ncbi:MAG: hypothetical protein LBH58_05370 [Tannerellaceae bacterium]|jgi:hypothetical protein|nr:hypothetical protein [Tannerellaceae bacterium]